MRISDWSADGCSSDLPICRAAGQGRRWRWQPRRQRAGRQRLISAMAGASSAVAVLGAGSWGTALAALIARHGHRTVLWGRDAAIVEAIDQRHENPRYLPGIALPEGLRATIDLAAAMRGADLVLVVR